MLLRNGYGFVIRKFGSDKLLYYFSVGNDRFLNIILKFIIYVIGY